MKSLLRNHFLAIVIGLVLSWIILIFFFRSSESFQIAPLPKDKVISASRTLIDTNISNLLASENLEVELAANLQDHHTITLMGSSEMTNLPYSSYRLLPDTMGVSVFGFGHQHHQSFAIYCELLALKEYIKDSKICIILSPGWFESSGTNIEAFLEFVRPNFLKRIALDTSVSLASKLVIGRYINQNYELIDDPNIGLDYFNNLYVFQHIPKFNDFFETNTNSIQKVSYIYENKVEHKIKKTSLIQKYAWNSQLSTLQTDFKNKIKSNKRFINDSYFKTYIEQVGGTAKKGNFDVLDISKNQEYLDFKCLLKLLKKENCQASFIMQGLNPLHYQNLSHFDPMLEQIKSDLKACEFPLHNQFTSKPNHYEPGTLTDIMHLGNYGWLKINRFLINTYEK